MERERIYNWLRGSKMISQDEALQRTIETLVDLDERIRVAEKREEYNQIKINELEDQVRELKTHSHYHYEGEDLKKW